MVKYQRFRIENGKIVHMSGKEFKMRESVNMKGFTIDGKHHDEIRLLAMIDLKGPVGDISAHKKNIKKTPQELSGSENGKQLEVVKVSNLKSTCHENATLSAIKKPESSVKASAVKRINQTPLSLLFNGMPTLRPEMEINHPPEEEQQMDKEMDLVEAIFGGIELFYSVDEDYHLPKIRNNGEVQRAGEDFDKCLAEQVGAASPIEKKKAQKMKKMFWCKFCDKYKSSIPNLKRHIILSHNKSNPIVNKWNYATWDLEISKTFEQPSEEDESN